ncbi:MAG: hypothetical protein R3B96_04315 [Pirellulaceae bacterium]
MIRVAFRARSSYDGALGRGWVQLARFASALAGAAGGSDDSRRSAMVTRDPRSIPTVRCRSAEFRTRPNPMERSRLVSHSAPATDPAQ